MWRHLVWRHLVWRHLVWRHLATRVLTGRRRRPSHGSRTGPQSLKVARGLQVRSDRRPRALRAKRGPAPPMGLGRAPHDQEAHRTRGDRSTRSVLWPRARLFRLPLLDTPRVAAAAVAAVAAAAAAAAVAAVAAEADSLAPMATMATATRRTPPLGALSPRWRPGDRLKRRKRPRRRGTGTPPPGPDPPGARHARRERRQRRPLRHPYPAHSGSSISPSRETRRPRARARSSSRMGASTRRATPTHASSGLRQASARGCAATSCCPRHPCCRLCRHHNWCRCQNPYQHQDQRSLHGRFRQPRHPRPASKSSTTRTIWLHRDTAHTVGASTLHTPHRPQSAVRTVLPLRRLG